MCNVQCSTSSSTSSYCFAPKPAQVFLPTGPGRKATHQAFCFSSDCYFEAAAVSAQMGFGWKRSMEVANQKDLNFWIFIGSQTRDRFRYCKKCWQFWAYSGEWSAIVITNIITFAIISISMNNIHWISMPEPSCDRPWIQRAVSKPRLLAHQHPLDSLTTMIKVVVPRVALS